MCTPLAEETKMEMTKVAPLEVTMPHQLPAEGSTTAGKKALAGSALALVLCMGLVAQNSFPAAVEVRAHFMPRVQSAFVLVVGLT
jgi:hypothetical protein